MKNESHMTHQRDIELWHDYYRTRNSWYEEKRNFTDKELINYVLKNNQPHFHLSFDYALRTVSRLINGRHSLSSDTLKRQMWNDIIEKVKNTMQRHRSMSVSDAVAHVLAFCKASRHYLSYNSARIIIARQRHLHASRQRA